VSIFRGKYRNERDTGNNNIKKKVTIGHGGRLGDSSYPWALPGGRQGNPHIDGYGMVKKRKQIPWANPGEIKAKQAKENRGIVLKHPQWFKKGMREREREAGKVKKKTGD